MQGVKRLPLNTSSREARGCYASMGRRLMPDSAWARSSHVREEEGLARLIAIAGWCYAARNCRPKIGRVGSGGDFGRSSTLPQIVEI